MDRNQQISNALGVGIELLSSNDIRVPTKDMEALVNLKGILRAVLSGELVIASPDSLKSEGTPVPKKEDGDSPEK